MSQSNYESYIIIVKAKGHESEIEKQVIDKMTCYNFKQYAILSLYSRSVLSKI
jgi:hypothetical protein